MPPGRLTGVLVKSHTRIRYNAFDPWPCSRQAWPVTCTAPPTSRGYRSPPQCFVVCCGRLWKPDVDGQNNPLAVSNGEPPRACRSRGFKLNEILVRRWGMQKFSRHAPNETETFEMYHHDLDDRRAKLLARERDCNSDRHEIRHVWETGATRRGLTAANQMHLCLAAPDAARSKAQCRWFQNSAGQLQGHQAPILGLVSSGWNLCVRVTLGCGGRQRVALLPQAQEVPSSLKQGA